MEIYLILSLVLLTLVVVLGSLYVISALKASKIQSKLLVSEKLLETKEVELSETKKTLNFVHQEKTRLVEILDETSQSSINQVEDLKQRLSEITSQKLIKDKAYIDLDEKYKQLFGQKKSSEVRTGQIAEIMVPFLDQFKYNPKSSRFLGEPLDYIIFNEDEVVFLEVKSGESKLNSKQVKIKKNVEAGKVRFEILRIGGHKNGLERVPGLSTSNDLCGSEGP